MKIKFIALIIDDTLQQTVIYCASKMCDSGLYSKGVIFSGYYLLYQYDDDDKHNNDATVAAAADDDGDGGEQEETFFWTLAWPATSGMKRCLFCEPFRINQCLSVCLHEQFSLVQSFSSHETDQWLYGNDHITFLKLC